MAFFDKITSLQNPRIKGLMELLEKPRERRLQQLSVVEGLREIQLAISSGYRIDTLYFCPELEGALPDEQAKFLFSISSTVPESYKAAAQKQELDVKTNSKGFISDAKPETFIKFINFGSSGGSDKR